MKVAILGLGSIGRRHGRNLRALDCTVTGFDPSEDRRAQFIKETGNAAVADSGAALAGADLACICSPNRFHTDQAIQAASQGCALFIEKPVGIDRAAVAALQAEVETHALFAHVGSNWKFHPAFTTMQALLAEGVLGRVTGAQVMAGQWLPDWHPWEDYRQMYSSQRRLGGGILLDSHEFDYLTWLLGPVTGVAGMAGRSGALDIDTEDVAAVALRFANGALATVQIDYIQREYRRRYHISGDQGTLEWDMATGVIRLFEAASKSTRTIEVGMADLNDMYIAQSRHILAGAKGKEKPVTSIRQAAAVLDILLTVKESLPA